MRRKTKKRDCSPTNGSIQTESAQKKIPTSLEETYPSYNISNAQSNIEGEIVVWQKAGRISPRVDLHLPQTAPAGNAHFFLFSPNRYFPFTSFLLRQFITLKRTP
jgi:hypothetical protein